MGFPPCSRSPSEPAPRAAGESIYRSLTDGETRNRTGDTTIFSRVLYQLSYLA